MKIDPWIIKELNLSELKTIKNLKYSKTENSWIEYYHRGIPAYRVEKAHIQERWDIPRLEIIKFNIFCFLQDILNEITPNGFRLPNENDWNEMCQDQLKIDNFIPDKFDGDHNSFCFNDDSFLLSLNHFLTNKPHKSFFIRDFERTYIFGYRNYLLNKNNQLESYNINDLVGYPRFIMKFISDAPVVQLKQLL